MRPWVAPASRRRFFDRRIKPQNRRRDAALRNDRRGSREAPSHVWKGTERFNLEIEVAERFFDGLVLGFLEGFLELAVENVFLLALRHPRIAKVVFSRLVLIG